MSTKIELIEGTKYKLGPKIELEDWDLRKAVERAYSRVCRHTNCLSSDLITRQSVANRATYPLSEFGAGTGSRIYHINEVYYDSERITYITWEELRNRFPDWRYDSSATPTFWTMLDSRTLLLYPSPIGAFTIAISGYITPDIVSWTDTDEPAFHEDYHELIEYHAAASLVVGVNDENFADWRQSRYGAQYLSGVETMKNEIFRTHGHIERMGQYGGSEGCDFFSPYFRVYPAYSTNDGDEIMDALTLLEAGTATIASTGTVQSLVSSSTECVLIWVGASCESDGTASNTNPIMLGDISYQVMPVLPADIKGSYIRINDASLLYLKGTAGDILNYIIWTSSVTT